jgi:hypothetical protein
MLQEVLNLNNGKEELMEEKLEQDKQINRSSYFCIGYSEFWKEPEPIHKWWLRKLRNRFNLKWLQISMSYHHFHNLREMFGGDLFKKLTNGVELTAETPEAHINVSMEVFAEFQLSSTRSLVR